jgi:hypothetical protein
MCIVSWGANSMSCHVINQKFYKYGMLTSDGMLVRCKISF